MTIYHTILVKFKQDTTPAEIDNIRARLRALPSEIPAISGIKAGQKIKHPADKDFDEGVILIFKDQDAFQSYFPHPSHLDFQKFFSPYLEDKMIFDIHVEE